MTIKGRTIRKVVGGGGGDFQFAGIFLRSACAGIFFSVDTLCTNFCCCCCFPEKKKL